MNTFSFECTYCGKKWEAAPTLAEEIASAKCGACKDTNLIIKDLRKSKIDYYQGTPPFPEKKEEPEQHNFVMADDYITGVETNVCNLFAVENGSINK